MHTEHRPVVQAGLAGALLILPPVAAAGEMTRLPVPSNIVASEVTGGDHTGRHLAGAGLLATGDGTVRVALQWTDGRPRVVDTAALQPYVDIFVNDVNSRGEVVGWRLNDTSAFRTDAWVYRAGRARVLPPLHPGDSTVAVAVNARGDIVGTDSGSADGVYREWAVRWPADRPGTVRELPVTGESPQVVNAVDIDDDGTVLGNVGFRPSEQQHPYVWPATGPGYPLAAPEGTGYPWASAVHAGQVVGTVNRWEGDTGYYAVARWNLPARSAQVVSTTEYSAVAVNRQGTIATRTALIHRDGTVRDLGGYVRVLSDRHTAAGADQEFLGGNAVVWTGY